ncbi:LytR/AlgR family response regulator transcription factor [Pseudobutyrivibrio xylanivorans]|uniref:Stage 0 sporulation protein A homolog n=3 Tax=Pseudobutyrivibrio xylanivorans TaxID=185007 RepID=A0A1M6KG64_PSEXY|nr:LytTR family DNA-binding domain-containing protein [Pseudobutyrivibrio xylanivorans]SCZ79158.1 two component transcriptional regulator, LytTR family [Pseudobutyrivibrio xylanivorans]SHJ57938.1 two component transcriptional regulator, LytTR family [Pseudobutyrivibrio xylanivorans DSM 14809]
MLRVAIVDDDGAYRKEIIDMLVKYEKEYGETFNITEYTDGDELVENYSSDFDIILLDVEMRFMDGMAAAGHVREVDPDVVIVFITNMPQYAINGYRVDALDYILKPIEYYPFSQTIKRAIGRRGNTDKKYIRVKIKGGEQKLDISHIRYIEVIGHDMIIHCIDSDIETKGTIREMEELLRDDYFFLCNKGFLVNLAQVDSIQGNDIIIGNDWVQVSRAKKKPFIDALNQYMRTMGH